MSRARTVVVSFVAAGAAVTLALGFPSIATALTPHTYFSGQTIQNAIRMSSTLTMKGGRSQTVVLGIDARVTQSGVGSAQGPWVVEVTHTSRVTYSYCQWRDDFPWGNTTNGIECSYLT